MIPEGTLRPEVDIGAVRIGGEGPFVLIAGPCVIEDRDTTLSIAKELKLITEEMEIPLIFKASYDKANRTSLHSYRGPGIDRGLEILSEVKEQYRLPVLSDVHRHEEVERASQVLDILQIPAFLCRQTDFVLEIARSGRAVNVKKGQFLAPWDMKYVVEKIRSVGNNRILLTERGTSFGYNNLVSDMRSLVILRENDCPVVYDATHSVQLPGGMGGASGGQRRFVPFLARAAVAVGVDAIFMEVHHDPDRALCDGPNSYPLHKLKGLLLELKEIDGIVKGVHTYKKG